MSLSSCCHLDASGEWDWRKIFIEPRLLTNPAQDNIPLGENI